MLVSKVGRVRALPHAHLHVRAAVHGDELVLDSPDEVTSRQAHVPDPAPHALDPAGLDVRLGRRPEHAADVGHVGRVEEARAMVQRPQPGELIGRARDLEGRRGQGRGRGAAVLGGNSVVIDDDDIVPLVHPRGPHVQGPEGPHHHLGVLVAVEARGGEDDAVVDIAPVVEDGPSAGAPADEGDLTAAAAIIPATALAGLGAEPLKKTEVHLQPGVLVPADDDAGVVGVQEEHGGLRVRVLEQEVLGREVEVGIVAA